MGVRIQELPETTGINKEDVFIVEDGQGTKKGTVQQLDESLGVSQLKEDIVAVRDAVCNPEEKTETFSKNTDWEKGYIVNASGNKTVDPTLAINSILTTHGGDTIVIDRGDGANVDVAYRVACYKNGAVVNDAGSNKSINFPYTVPDGIDGIIFTISSAYVKDTRTPFFKITRTTTTYVPKVDGSVCTQTKNGLMSYSDKIKLDNIQQEIILKGNGTYKNASAYGFLPTKSAEENSIALQSVLDGGGRILVDMKGTYKVCKTAMLDSNTELIFGKGVYIKRDEDSNGVTARYPFTNRGAIDGSGNENISIIGLNLIVGEYGEGSDIANTLTGQKGQLAFQKIKHLVIKDFTVKQGSAEYYNIHIQDFDDILLENIYIESVKDGIHLGRGKNFHIKNAWLATGDDAIALNAHDYPTGTSKLGWIENGVIENVHLIAFSDTSWYSGSKNLNALGRGLYMLGGAWKDWESGMTVRTYGDAVVSDGRIYRTVGTIDASLPTIISTDKPTHTEGTMTYPDGVSWMMAQDTDIVYNAGVRNIVFRDVFIDKPTDGAMTFNIDDDLYSRGYYPGAEMPIMENITLEGLRVINNSIRRICNSIAPVNNLKIVNCDYECSDMGIRMTGNLTDNYGDSNILMLGTSFRYTNGNGRLIAYTNGNRTMKLRIVGSNVLSIGTPYKYEAVSGATDILVNDIGI